MIKHNKEMKMVQAYMEWAARLYIELKLHCPMKYAYPSFLYPFIILYRLWTRKEKEIAIVSHAVFLYDTFATDCHSSGKTK